MSIDTTAPSSARARTTGSDPPQLLLDRGPVGTGPGRLATDVDDVRPGGQHVAAVRQGGLRLEPLATVGERVRRHVDDAHDQGPVALGDQGCGLRPHHGIGHLLPSSMSAMASARVAGSRSWPRTAEVIVRAPGLRMPRIDMQRCSAWTTTMTPCTSKVLDEGVGDLRGQALLDLRATGEDLDEPGELGQPGDPAVLARDVADVGDAVERHEVVLARAVELDVADDDELVVVDLEGRAEHVLGRHVEAGEDLGVGARDACRRVEQPLAIRVLADGQQQLPHGSRSPRLVDRHGSALLAGVDGLVVRAPR